MTWPLPAPGTIAGQVASVYESAPGLAGIDARSPNTIAGVNARAIEMALFDLYLYQSNLAAELMPDTAIDTLARHAAIWGVTRLQPTASFGTAPFVGVDVSIPAGFQVVAPSGAIFATTNVGTIIGGGSVTLVLTSLAPGSAQNLPAGTVCKAVSPLAGLNPQSVVLAGQSGGTDIEGIEAWRARILARIREPANGGSADDYVTWAKAALDSVAYAETLPGWAGLGTVGVAIAMAGPVVATSPELAAVASYIDARRPVTAAVTVMAASLAPVNVSLHINPDTSATRAAVVAALQLAFLQDATIGGTVFMSRLDNAVSSSGEYSHERFAPTADVVMSPTQLPILGTVSFT